MTDLSSPLSTNAWQNRWSKQSPLFSALLTAVPGILLLAHFHPMSPDLMAQLARAAGAHATKGAMWWTSWYGGVTTPSYSVLTPSIMNVLGVWPAGLLSVIVLALGAGKLFANTQRPHLGVALMSVGAVANIASGRITFGIGAAFGVVALWQLRSRHLIAAVALSVLATLASPLAGLFLGLIAVALLPDRAYRRTALLIAGAMLVIMIASTLAFPLPGRMPSRVTDLISGLGGCTLGWFAIPVPAIRRTIALLAIAVVGAFLVPSSIGSNILRMSMLFGAATIVATSTLPRKKLLPVVAVFLSVLSFNTVNDLKTGSNRSTESAFYAPLLAQLPTADRATNRIEVVDPATHSPALYVAKQLPLARGWERQVDATRNSLFYTSPLNADSYRAWLNGMAVKWVALPNAPLDYASQDEADLVRNGLPYLHLTWQNADWRLYQVDDAAPLAAAPLQTVSIGADSITLQASGPTTAQVQVQWTPGLVVDPAGSVTRSADGDWIVVHVPAAGTYRLHYHLT